MMNIGNTKYYTCEVEPLWIEILMVPIFHALVPKMKAMTSEDLLSKSSKFFTCSKIDVVIFWIRTFPKESQF